MDLLIIILKFSKFDVGHVKNIMAKDPGPSTCIIKHYFEPLHTL